MSVKNRLNKLKKELALGGMITLGVASVHGQSSMSKDFDDFKDKNKKEFADFKSQSNDDLEAFKEKSKQAFADFKKQSMESFGAAAEKNSKDLAEFNERSQEKSINAANTISNANNGNADAANGAEANLSWKTTKEGVKYALTDSGIKLQANIAVDTYRLMPKTYEVDDNGAGRKVFECGGIYNSNKTGLNMLISEKIKMAIIANSIVKDIKESYGDNIPAQAKNIVNNTEKSMQMLGLVEKDGKYFQTNPDLMRTGGHVKDKNSLAKQKEKDTKEAAQYVQKQMSAQQLAYAKVKQNER